MITIKRQGFSFKFIMLIVFVLILLGTASTVQTRVMLYRVFSEQQEKRGVSLANMLAMRAANLILVNNYYELHELVKEVQDANDDVRYVFVVNKDNELLAHSFTDGFPQDLLLANVTEPAATNHTATLSTEEGLIRDIAVPIFEGRIGFVHIGLNDTGLSTILAQTTRQLLFDTLAALLIGGVLIILLTRHLTKPIRELIKVSNSVKSGDLTQRVAVTADDEIGILAATFNSMTEHLQNLLLELKQKEEARTHLLQKVITAQEEERKRIARELHDETGQTLTSLLMGLKALDESCPNGSRKCQLEEMRGMVKRTIGEIRHLAVELRPSILDDMGLVPALQRYVNEYRDTQAVDIDLHVSWRGEERLPHEIEVIAYRIIQESLTNIAKYAQASNISVIVTLQENGFEGIVEDDGVGFSVDEMIQDHAEGTKLGLYGMRERANLVGGTLTIESRPGRGTTIYIRVPLTEGEQNGQS